MSLRFVGQAVWRGLVITLCPPAQVGGAGRASCPHAGQVTEGGGRSLL